MQKSLTAFFSGLALSVLIAAYAYEVGRRRRLNLGRFDLNRCSIEDLRSLGLEEGTSERIIESRPYRSKLELLSRVMLPNEVYVGVKNRVTVANPDEPVKVAS
jgi:hypothetical protein